MAVIANITDKKRKRFGCSISVNLQGYNGTKATDRNGRCKGR